MIEIVSTLTVLARRGAAYVAHSAFLPGAGAASAAFDGPTADVSAVFDAAACSSLADLVPA